MGAQRAIQLDSASKERELRVGVTTRQFTQFVRHGARKVVTNPAYRRRNG